MSVFFVTNLTVLGLLAFQVIVVTVSQFILKKLYNYEIQYL